MNINIKKAFLLFIFILGLSACASQPVIREDVKPESFTIQDGENTWLGKLFSSPPKHSQQTSGFYLLDKGEEALLWRGALADSSQRTIDAQYYIWNADNVGTIAAEHLLRAANRGVRVRVLIDDFMINANPKHLALLNSHPKVHIRIYNPIGTRDDLSFPRFLSFLGDFSKLNRRMHNKLFIADGNVVIMGGRNIGDEYFDMHQKRNFRDRDLIVAGQVVPDISRSFDLYWNSEWSVPLKQVFSYQPKEAEQKAYYKNLHDHADKLKTDFIQFSKTLSEIHGQVSHLPHKMTWGKATVIFDIPGKNEEAGEMKGFGHTGQMLTEAALETRSEILAETPYLLMMPGTFEILDTLKSKGVRVRIITNSLASTDSTPVFSLYRNQRQEILNHDVELYEFRPDAAVRKTLINRWSLMKEETLLSLHAKTAVFDRKRVFIGTFNLDPRSTHLNTEIGLLIDSPEFALQVTRLLEEDLKPENSWKLSLNEEGELLWNANKNDNGEQLRHDPMTGILKELKVFLISFLPIDRLL